MQRASGNGRNEAPDQMLMRLGRRSEARLSSSKMVLGAVEQLPAARRAPVHLSRDLLVGVLKDLAQHKDPL